jgi:hypothetical protein
MARDRTSRTKRQATDRRSSPSVQDRVYESDFDAVRPGKLLPGVVGRARWFAERSGDRPNALAVSRLLAGVRDAQRTLEPAELRANAVERGHALLESASKTARERVLPQQKPLLLDARGRSVPLKAQSGKREALTGLIGPLDIEREGILFVPVDDEWAEHLDLEAVVVAEVSDRREAHLIHTFSYWPQEQMIVGEVRGPGLYQAFAPPKDP